MIKLGWPLATYAFFWKEREGLFPRPYLADTLLLLKRQYTEMWKFLKKKQFLPSYLWVNAEVYERITAFLAADF